MRRKNLLIKEKYLRKIIKEVDDNITNTSGAPAPSPLPAPAPSEVVEPTSENTSVIDNLDQLYTAFKNENLEEKVKSGAYDVTKLLDFYFNAEILGPGIVIKDFLVEFAKILDKESEVNLGSLNNMFDVVNGLISVVDGSPYEKDLEEGEIDKINKALYNATEGGTGLGTYSVEIGEALGSSSASPIGAGNFSCGLDAYFLNKRYSTYADSGSGFWKRQYSKGTDLRDTIYQEFGSGGEKANIQRHVINQLAAKFYFKFLAKNDNPTDPTKVTLDDIFYNFIKLAKDNIKGLESSDKTVDDSTTSGEEIDGVTPSEPSAKIKVSPRTPSKEKIKATNLLAVIPRRLDDDSTGFEFKDIFDLNTFREGLISNLNIDNSGFYREHRYQFEVSFKKGNPDDLVEIDMNTSPIGTHRIVMAGKLLKKAIKGKKWDGNLKKIVGQSLNDAAQEKETKNKDLKGLRRFRFTIVIPPGTYTLTENKMIIKGKDLLKIISQF